MYILLSRYVKPLEEVERVLEEHRAFLARYYASGTFIASGPLVPRTGGVILAKGESRAEMDKILAEDPFLQQGVSEYDILEFNPNRGTETFYAAIGLQ